MLLLGLIIFTLYLHQEISLRDVDSFLPTLTPRRLWLFNASATEQSSSAIEPVNVYYEAANVTYEITYNPKEVTVTIDETKEIDIKDDACKILQAQLSTTGTSSITTTTINRVFTRITGIIEFLVDDAFESVHVAHEFVHSPNTLQAQLINCTPLEPLGAAMTTTGTSSTTIATINRVFTRITGMIEFLVEATYEFVHTPNIPGILQLAYAICLPGFVPGNIDVFIPTLTPRCLVADAYEFVHTQNITDNIHDNFFVRFNIEENFLT